MNEDGKQNINQKFPKGERLKSRKKITELFRTGKVFNGYPVQIIFLLSEVENNNRIQAGFSVSKKLFNKAVDRNRIKRQMREAYRNQKRELEKSIQTTNFQLSIMFIFKGHEKVHFNIIQEKIFILLQRLDECMRMKENENFEQSSKIK